MKKFTVFLLFALLFQGLLAGCTTRNSVQSAANPQYVDAQELKLKMRELADQLLATTPNGGISDLVALPTSFVDLDNKRRTSPLGNFIAESLIYEFNQRSYPVCEYRLTGNIDMILGQGDFALLRQGVMQTVNKKWAALIVGTYYVTDKAVFVNARLVRADDGMVLRTGQVLLPQNALVASMLKSTSLYAGNGYSSGTGSSVKSGSGVPVAVGTYGNGASTGTSNLSSGSSTTTVAYANSNGGLLSSGNMYIVPAPWKTRRAQKNPGRGLYSTPRQ